MTELTESDAELLLTGAGLSGVSGRADLDGLGELLMEARLLGDQPAPQPTPELAAFLAHGTFAESAHLHAQNRPSRRVRTSGVRRGLAGLVASAVAVVAGGMTGVLPAAAQDYFDRATTWVPWRQVEPIGPSGSAPLGMRQPVRAGLEQVELRLERQSAAAPQDGAEESAAQKPGRDGDRKAADRKAADRKAEPETDRKPASSVAAPESPRAERNEEGTVREPASRPSGSSSPGRPGKGQDDSPGDDGADDQGDEDDPSGSQDDEDDEGDEPADDEEGESSGEDDDEREAGNPGPEEAGADDAED